MADLLASKDEAVQEQDRTRLEIGEAEQRSEQLSAAAATLTTEIESLRSQQEVAASSLAKAKQELSALNQQIDDARKQAPTKPDSTTTATAPKEMTEEIEKLIAQKNYQGAMGQLKSLASDCHTKAQIQLAELYLAGLGIPAPDPFKAYLWFKAAESRAGGRVSAGLAVATRDLQAAQVKQAEHVAESIVAKCP